MRIRPSPHPLALVSLLLLTAPWAHADETSPYLGLSAGQANSNFDNAELARRQLGAEQSIIDTLPDHRGKAFKLFGGVQFTRNWGMEAGYFNLGQFGQQSNVAPMGALTGRLKVQGLNLDLVGTAPLGDSLSAQARLGGIYARTRADEVGTGGVLPLFPTASERSGGLKMGVGLQWAWTPSFLMRADAERYRVADGAGSHANINVYTLGLVFPFGRHSPPPVRMAQVAMPPPPAPMPPPPVVMPPPAPMPPPPPPPAPPPVRKVSFSAESLFGFDRHQVRPEGMHALDTLVQELRGSRYEIITVQGHTDRLGTSAYNDNLSRQRAEAVKSYLVSPGGLDAAKIEAVGLGETQPVTSPDACKGTKPTPALRHCLQADRRVEVQVNGVR